MKCYLLYIQYQKKQNCVRVPGTLLSFHVFVSNTAYCLVENTDANGVLVLQCYFFCLLYVGQTDNDSDLMSRNNSGFCSSGM
jgi:hypothetical protein